MLATKHCPPISPQLPSKKGEKWERRGSCLFFFFLFSPPKLEKDQRELGYRRRAPCLLLVKRSALERQPTDTLLIEWSRRLADSETEQLWSNG